ncbi:MAG TPA: pyridoxal-dependent decarboxylase [Gaiellaceae bacterium]|nr:pyridoxal-dependent decarboxylase [Gaiellaceae bacterium]
MRALVDEPLPQEPAPVDAVLAELVEKVSPGLAGTTSGGYFGYVTGGVLPAAAIAQAWAAAVDQNPGLWALGPAASELEHVVLAWIADLLGYPAGGATFTSGAAGANVVALAVARHALGRKHGVDVKRQGVRALSEFAVYGSQELHFTDVKALWTLGLGSDCLRTVPVDGDYRFDVRALREAIERDREAGVEPAIVVAHAGSVNTGASDPLEQLAALRDEHGFWLHVDGAFGAFLRLCERTAPQVAGLELADSLAVDGHKWLNLPNGTAFALVRDGALHREAFAGTAAYLTRASRPGEDMHELGVEASRPWRGAAAWAALKQLGRSGVVDLVTRCCDLTRELAALVEASPRLELTAPVPSCVVCFRYRPEGWAEGERLDELNRRIQHEVADTGDVFATGASLASGFSLRACIVHWRTTEEHVRALVDQAERAGERLSR